MKHKFNIIANNNKIFKKNNQSIKKGYSYNKAKKNLLCI